MMSRRLSRRPLLVELILLIGVAACRAAAPVAQSQVLEDRAIRRELAAINEAMAATFNRGDYLGAARFYSDDAQIIGQQRHELRCLRRLQVRQDERNRLRVFARRPCSRNPP
jgi:hypothetical protein